MVAERQSQKIGIMFGAHGDFSFSVLIIRTDLFTPMKVIDLFNIHSLEVIILIV